MLRTPTKLSRPRRQDNLVEAEGVGEGAHLLTSFLQRDVGSCSAGTGGDSRRFCDVDDSERQPVNAVKNALYSGSSSATG